jgi:hypothetical protein
MTSDFGAAEAIRKNSTSNALDCFEALLKVTRRIGRHSFDRCRDIGGGSNQSYPQRIIYGSYDK